MASREEIIGPCSPRGPCTRNDTWRKRNLSLQRVVSLKNRPKPYSLMGKKPRCREWSGACLWEIPSEDLAARCSHSGCSTVPLHPALIRWARLSFLFCFKGSRETAVVPSTCAGWVLRHVTSTLECLQTEQTTHSRRDVRRKVVQFCCSISW